MNLKELHKIMCDAYGISNNKQYMVCDNHDDDPEYIIINLDHEYGDANHWIDFCISLIPGDIPKWNCEDTQLIVDTSKYITISTPIFVMKNNDIDKKIKIIPSKTDINRFFNSNFFKKFELMFKHDPNLYNSYYLGITGELAHLRHNIQLSFENKNSTKISTPRFIDKPYSNITNKFQRSVKPLIKIIPFIGDWRKNDPIGYDIEFNIKRDVTNEDINYLHKEIVNYLESRGQECKGLDELSTNEHLSVYQSGSHKITARIVL